MAGSRYRNSAVVFAVWNFAVSLSVMVEMRRFSGLREMGVAEDVPVDWPWRAAAAAATGEVGSRSWTRYRFRSGRYEVAVPIFSFRSGLPWRECTVTVLFRRFAGSLVFVLPAPSDSVIVLIFIKSYRKKRYIIHC